MTHIEKELTHGRLARYMNAVVYQIRWTIEQREKFVRRWLRFREKYGLTQQGLADAMGIHVRTVQRIERGNFVPREETVNEFAEVERKYKVGAETERSLAWVPGETEI